MKPEVLARHLVGGLTVGEIVSMGFDLDKFRKISLGAAVVDDPGFFVLPPVPNTLFQRDPSCWIYNGVTVNPMFWPARRREALNMLTVYRFHPMLQGADFEFWYPEEKSDGSFNIQDFGRASMEGGDVQPIGHGTTLLDDPGVADLIRERDVTIEACLTSNLHTGAVAEIAAHPLPRMLAGGVRVRLFELHRLHQEIPAPVCRRRPLHANALAAAAKSRDVSEWLASEVIPSSKS